MGALAQVPFSKSFFAASHPHPKLAVSINWGSFFVGVLITRAPVFGVYTGAFDFLNIPKFGRSDWSVRTSEAFHPGDYPLVWES